MMDRFLKAKHWQIFLLIFGIPISTQILLMVLMIVNFSTDSNPENLLFIFGYMKFFPILMIVFMSVFLGWFWAVASGLQRIIPEEFKLKLGFFKAFLLYPMVYILFFIAFFMTILFNQNMNPILFLGIIPFHLFAMFCIFYCMYIVAKTIKTAELQRKVTFSDFAGEFFMIWFYPVGIWVLQPKINKMIEEKTDQLKQ